MNVEQTLRIIESRLSRIEELLTAPTKSEALSRRRYSVAEVAVLCDGFGIKSYAQYTIRKACSDGRIPEAEKLDDGKTWSVPREAVLRILDEGFPPERRNNNGQVIADDSGTP